MDSSEFPCGYWKVEKPPPCAGENHLLLSRLRCCRTRECAVPVLGSDRVARTNPRFPLFGRPDPCGCWPASVLGDDNGEKSKGNTELDKSPRVKIPREFQGLTHLPTLSVLTKSPDPSTSSGQASLGVLAMTLRWELLKVREEVPWLILVSRRSVYRLIKMFQNNFEQVVPLSLSDKTFQCFFPWGFESIWFIYDLGSLEWGGRGWSSFPVLPSKATECRWTRSPM